MISKGRCNSYKLWSYSRCNFHRLWSYRRNSNKLWSYRCNSNSHCIVTVTFRDVPELMIYATAQRDQWHFHCSSLFQVKSLWMNESYLWWKRRWWWRYWCQRLQIWLNDHLHSLDLSLIRPESLQCPFLISSSFTRFVVLLFSGQKITKYINKWKNHSIAAVS